MQPDAAHAPPARWLVGASLVAVYIIWGTTYFALKIGALAVGPYFFVGTRFIVAGALLFAWLRLRGHRLPTPRQWRGSGILGFLLLVTGLGSVTVAEKSVSSGAAAALISVLPLATALWSGILQKWASRREWLAIGVGAVGALVMVSGQDLRASPTGTVLVLSGTVSWSLGTVLSSRIESPPGAMGFASEMLAGGVIALAVSVLLGESWSLPQSSEVWWAWVYLVVFGSLIAFSAYRFLVDRVSPTLAATYAYVNPPVALLVGWWLGDETFSLNVLIGLPIVLVAVGWLAWPQLRGSYFTAGAVTTTSTSPQVQPHRQ